MVELASRNLKKSEYNPSIVTYTRSATLSDTAEGNEI